MKANSITSFVLNSTQPNILSDFQRKSKDSPDLTTPLFKNISLYLKGRRTPSISKSQINLTLPIKNWLWDIWRSQFKQGNLDAKRDISQLNRHPKAIFSISDHDSLPVSSLATFARKPKLTASQLKEEQINKLIGHRNIANNALEDINLNQKNPDGTWDIGYLLHRAGIRGVKPTPEQKILVVNLANQREAKLVNQIADINKQIETLEIEKNSVGRSLFHINKRVANRQWRRAEIEKRESDFERLIERAIHLFERGNIKYPKSMSVNQRSCLCAAIKQHVASQGVVPDTIETTDGHRYEIFIENADDIYLQVKRTRNFHTRVFETITELSV